MSEHNVTVDGGSSVRLKTAGKYCDRDIVVTATEDHTFEDGLVDGTATEYINDRISAIGQYAFYRNSSLKSVSFPSATATNQYAFGYCTNLRDVSFPSLKTVGAYVFQSCGLKSVEFPSLTTIGISPFTGCNALVSIILPGSTICSLRNTSSLSGTPIAKGTGFVYVPDELGDAYKAETNWSTYADQIRAIEDYPEICGGTA